MAKRMIPPVRPQAIPQTSTEETLRFRSRQNLTALSHGLEVFSAVDGILSLPAKETWYRHLIASGDLVIVHDTNLQPAMVGSEKEILDDTPNA